MKVLILNDNSGPKYHRLLLPCFLMPGIELVVSPVLTDEICEGIDILFFNRVISNHSINSVLQLKEKYGFKIIVDFDDHWNLGPDHYLYQIYEATQASDIMRGYVIAADAVTVTHERLWLEASQLNKNVHILPNAIPYWGQFSIKKTPSDITRLFWAGGITHVKDIELLRNPVKKFSNLPVKMVLGGYSERPEYKRIASAFTNGGQLPNLLIQSLPVLDYYHTYSECDIALTPLTETTFNSHKSNLKVLEAANIGANVIVSNVHPYKDLPYVNYVNNSGDWFKHVKMLLDNPGFAKEQAEQLQTYCRERFNFEKINKERYDIFKNLCNKQTETSSKNTEVSTMPG